jgi:hypothetical protein
MSFPTRRIMTVGVLTVGGGTLMTRPWLHAGSTRAERRTALPGDEWIARPKLTATRAVTIDAPPAGVWPWLLQMGHGRAGWYGYDLWDNAGEDSAETVIPELQHLAVGDVIADATGPFGFKVMEIEPEHTIVFRATIHPITGKVVDRHRQPGRSFIDFTWAFVLTPLADERSRLVVRVRYDRSPRWWVACAVEAYELVDAVFTRKMLSGIRERAQGRAVRHAHLRPPAATRDALA